MPYRFNPPPNWPPPPPGWQPDEKWFPDASWGPAPLYWELWVGEGRLERWQKRLARQVRDMSIRAASSNQAGFQLSRIAAASDRTANAAEEIRRLTALRDEGLITDEELEAKRRQILGI